MSAATSLSLPEFYKWSFPGAPIQVHLSLNVVARLRTQILASGKDSGVLSGSGLLLGHTGQPGITRVLDFKPLRTLDAASVDAARRASSGEVVGFYRTTPSFGVAMPDQDRALAASCFSHPSSVFLLIEIGKSSVGDAHFGFWGDGQLFDWPLMRFPFDEEELAVEEKRRRPNKVREMSQVSPEVEPVLEVEPVKEPAPPAVAPILVSETPPVSRVEQPQRPRRRWLVPVLATLLIASVIAGALFYSMYVRRASNLPVAPQAAPARADAKPSLGLAVEGRGGDLRVSWNGSAAVIANADYGMLLIRGSGVSRDVPLTAEELRSGSVVYSPPVDEVRFQLNVVAGEQVTREFLTVVLPKTAETQPVKISSKVSTPNVAGQPKPPAPGGSEPLRELREFKPVEPRDSATGTPLRIEEPPTALLTPTAVSLPNQPAVSLPAPAEVPPQRIPQVEAPPSTVGAYPPVATNKVIPPVPSLLRGVLWKPVVVDVMVSVNESGNVVKAEAVKKSGVNPLLSDAAVQAARRWKFRPAQFDGHPVPAEIVLQFNFSTGR
jgi:periplasmic protein TonB